ncbi:MAG: hypothetical protein HY258_07440 [Chloroflexi bacterium]|nr:hypothetical protein [Chloroflexota bacterium]
MPHKHLENARQVIKLEGELAARESHNLQDWYDTEVRHLFEDSIRSLLKQNEILELFELAEELRNEIQAKEAISLSRTMKTDDSFLYYGLAPDIDWISQLPKAFLKEQWEKKELNTLPVRIEIRFAGGKRGSDCSISFEMEIMRVGVQKSNTYPDFDSGYYRVRIKFGNSKYTIENRIDRIEEFAQEIARGKFLESRKYESCPDYNDYHHDG